MAEAIARDLGHSASSAGTHPPEDRGVAPNALIVLEEISIDTNGLHPKSVDLVDPENFDKEVGIPNAKSLLENHGIKIATKSDLLAEPPSRDSYVAYWSVDNELAPGLVYFILAFLPIAISSSPYSKPEIVVVDEPVLTRETLF